MKMRRDNEGVVLVWSVLTVLVLALFIGLTIDTGYYLWAAQELQITADASALGGAAVIRENAIGAHWKAIEVGLANNVAWESVSLHGNFANAADGDISHGSYDRFNRVFDTTAESPNAVRVIARRTPGSLNGPLPTLFADIVGIPSISIARDAIAMIKGGLGPGILILNGDVPCAFDVRGTTGEVSVSGGAIYIDSNDFEAACHSGRPTVSAPEMYVVGEPGLDGRWDDQVNFDGYMYSNEPYLPDPLLGMPEPYYYVPHDLGGILLDDGSSMTRPPGYYSGGITQRNGELTLLPGVYVLDGVGLDVNGGTLIAHDVLLFVVDTTLGDPNESRVNIRGNIELDISGFSDFSEGSYFGVDVVPEHLEFVDGGIPIWQDDDNTNDSRILGTSSFNISGTIYMPGNHLEIGGEGDSFAWGIIADTLQAHGDGVLNIDYHDQFSPVPKSVFLVE